MLLLKTILLGIIEGVTEFIPVSSTGHLLLAQHWMNIPLEEGFWKTFTVFIQIGAILAVVVYFRERILQLLRNALRTTEDRNDTEGQAPAISTDPPAISTAGETESATAVAARERTSAIPRRLRPLVTIAVGTVPVLVVGFFAKNWIDANLGSAAIVAWSLLLGGIAIAAIEWLRPAASTHCLEDVTIPQALLIGLTQILAAVFPGTSRSAATIMPGMLVGLSRSTSAEFSFFLAIPAMFAAGGYSILKLILDGPAPTTHEWFLLAVGTVVSFLVAWLVIALFMGYVRRYSFMPFAIWRIVLAIIVFVIIH